MYLINSFCAKVDSEQLDRVSDHIRTNKTNFLRMVCGPEHILPQGVTWKSLEHALYVKYTCLIDYNLRRVVMVCNRAINRGSEIDFPLLNAQKLKEILPEIFELQI